MLIKNAFLPQNLRQIIDNYKTFLINTYQIKLLSNKKIHLLTMKLLVVVAWGFIIPTLNHDRNNALLLSILVKGF